MKDCFQLIFSGLILVVLSKLLIPLIFIAKFFVKISEVQNNFKSYVVKLFAYTMMKWIWVITRNAGEIPGFSKKWLVNVQSLRNDSNN